MGSSRPTTPKLTFIGATVLAVLFTALLSLGTGKSAASSGAANKTRATLIASVAIPNDGPIAYGMGSLWVIDRENGDIRGGVPQGRLYRVDPHTLRVTDLIRNVTGGSEAVSNASVWIASFALDRLLRVDPATHRVTWIATGSDSDPGTLNVLPAAGSIWVSNHHDGTVAVVDPITNHVTTSIPVFRSGCCGAQALATDGTSIWVAIPGIDLSESAIVRIDASTPAVTGTLTGIPDGPCGGLTVAARTVWSTAGNCDGEGIMLDDAATNQLTGYFHLPGTPGDLTYAFGSIWLLTTSPDQLVRIDPTTHAVISVLPLPADPWGTNAVLSDGHRLWVRVHGALLSIAPQ